MYETQALSTSREKNRIVPAMNRIEGKALAATIEQEVASLVKTLPVQPTLAVLLVGDDPASHLYVRLKKEAAERAGIRVLLEQRPTDTHLQDLLAVIQKWNADQSIHAILVQLPLPSPLNETTVIDAIDPKKDVDGFHPENVKVLLAGTGTIIPPLHEGILRLINEAPVMINDARVSIIANSDVFAAPLRRLLTTAGARVTTFQPDSIAHDELKQADIIVIAIGRPAFLHASMTKDDVVIVDVGTTRGADGKVHGDVDLGSFATTNAWVTPVPGGVGPMTVAQLLKNVVTLARTSTL